MIRQVVILALVFCNSYGHSFAQSLPSLYMGPQSGGQPKSFSTLQDNLSFLNTSVNQFNGQVEFTLPIMKISGQGSLNYALSFNYTTANLPNLVSTWNRDMPTGVLGLGWSFDMPRIAVDYKGTTTRADDDFYLIENGSTNPLIFNDSSFNLSNNGSGAFYAKNYMDWIIQYDGVNEKWTIIKDDGTTFVYGDKNSGRNTVQYMIAWGNWIGDSSMPTGQQQMVYVWNLSQIKNLWSDTFTFTYVQDQEHVGSGSLVYTKASYLSEIRNVNNEKISFVYQLKTANGTTNEYVDVHTEVAEPDAYQEKYESKYLDRVVRYDENGNELFDIRFGYSFLGTGELAKRLLASITQYSSLGNSLPGIVLTYETRTSSSANTGALVTVQSPTKGINTFVYSKVTLPAASRSFILPPVSGTNTNYKEPNVFYGEDYVVVTRRFVPPSGHDYNPQDVVVDVITWDGGRWNQQTLGSIGSASANQDQSFVPQNGVAKQDFEVATGKDFFAVYNENTGKIFLFKRNEKLLGAWYSFSDNIPPTTAYDYLPLLVGAHQCYEGFMSTLSVAGNSVFIGSQEGYINQNRIYYYNPQSGGYGNWSYISLSKPTVDLPQWGTVVNQYFYTVANNYVIMHEDTKNTMDVLVFSYLSPSNTAAPTINSQTLPIQGTYGNSYWYGAGSYSVMMAGGGSSYPHRIYYWDQNYNFQPTYSTGISPPAYTYVNNVNNSLAVISDVSGVWGFRFDGQAWHSTSTMDYGGPNFLYRTVVSMGNDLIIRPRPVSVGNYFGTVEFSPNTLAWNTPASLNILANNNASNLIMIAGNNFVNLAGTYYFRNTDGSWNADPFPSSVKASGSNNSNDYYLQGGLSFVAPGSAYVPAFAELIKNGVIQGSNFFMPPYSLNNEYIWDRPNYLPVSSQCNYNTMVTYLDVGYADVGGTSVNVAVSGMAEASRLKLHRLVSNLFSEGLDANNRFIESISLFVVTQTSSNDNVQTISTTYDYNANSALNNATTDINGNVPCFNHVRSIVGSTSVSNKPYGYTDSYFFNGLPSSTLVSVDPNAALPSYASLFYRICTGVQYATYIFDVNGTNMSTSNTDFQLFDFTNRSFVNLGIYVRPIASTGTIDNMATTTSYTYGTSSTQLATKTVSSIADFYNDSYVYYSNGYGSTNNIVSIPIGDIPSNSNVSPVATKWKPWGPNNIPGPFQTYVWLSGSTDFSPYWSPSSTVPSNWKLVNMVNAMDYNKGLATEIMGTDGITEATIWHPTRPLALAKIKNASVSQVYYEGFEYWKNGNTNTVSPLAGSTYYSFPASGATLNFVLGSTGTYRITYWTRASQSSSWILTTSTFTGSSYSLTLNGIDIDEVRIHPVNALMLSVSYDRFGNHITECDANNKVTYFEYDEFNRAKLTRDENRNILEYNTYNIKN